MWFAAIKQAQLLQTINHTNETVLISEGNTRRNVIDFSTLRTVYGSVQQTMNTHNIVGKCLHIELLTR